STDEEDSEEKKESDNEASDKKKTENDGNDENDAKEGDAEIKKTTQKTPNKENDKEDSDTEKHHRKNFIKLACPHYNVKCLSFGKYSAHLHSSRHVTAMRHVAMKQKNAQRKLEKSTDDLAPRTNFCSLCKLNYKQLKATHQASDSHKNMKKFLMPYCRVCRITFKTRNEMNGDKSDKDDGSGNEEYNLENFMTINSVGDKINVGIEQIRKIEVYYCELCHMYLPRVENADLERTLAKHCKQRTHMQRYIRYKEDKEIASRAEPDDANEDLGDILAEAESGNKSSDED
ncbi:hypothetical protein RN001_007265, partial [Aquatica leii]